MGVSGMADMSRIADCPISKLDLEWTDIKTESPMKLSGMCCTAVGLILSPVGTATAQKLPLTGTSIFQSDGYGAYPFSLDKDPKVCLTRTSNGIRECRTRDDWARIARELSKHQKGK